MLAASAFAFARLDTGSGGSGVCAYLLYWHGDRYSGNSVTTPLTLGARLPRDGRLPGCVDTPGATPADGRRVVVYRIAGTPPSRAVALRGERTTEVVFDGHGPP